MPTEPTEPALDDTVPVGGNEVLMRRVLKRLVDFDRGKTPPLQAGAFLPNKRDNDGLSLNRQVTDHYKHFLTADGLKNWHEVPENIRVTCGVVAVLAEVARDIGLTVNPDPSTTPGHVLIQEINWNQYAGDATTDASRLKIEEWALQLAKRANVLIQPGKPPDPPTSTAA